MNPTSCARLIQMSCFRNGSMSVMEVNVNPYPNACDPTLLVKVKIQYSVGYAVFLGTEGFVASKEGKMLGALELLPNDECKFEEALQPWDRIGSGADQTTRSFSYTVKLSGVGLAHIETLRQKDRKKDVILVFDFVTRLFHPQFTRAQVATVALDQNIQQRVFGSHDPSRRGILVTTSGNGGEPSLLSGMGSVPGSIGKYSWYPQKGIEHTIRSSDWVSDFAPVFGLGRSLVIEVPEVEPPLTDGDLGRRLKEAAEALPKMREDITKGEWTTCAEDARPIIELLNKKDLVLNLLTSDGLPRDAAESLVTGVSGIFDYASKFHHRVERDGSTVTPPVKAEKEDAYLAYMNAVTLVNLVSQKARKKTVQQP